MALSSGIAESTRKTTRARRSAEPFSRRFDVISDNIGTGSDLELLKEILQIVQAICLNDGEVGRASCTVGGLKDPLNDLL